MNDKALSDERFADYIKRIRENSVGKMLLFWIELYKQKMDK